MRLPKISKRWSDLAVVAASGNSLTEGQIKLCEGRHLLVVNDAYRLAPHAEVLYACDPHWWGVHQERLKEFKGERWSSHQRHHNDKLVCAEKYGLKLVSSDDCEGFSMEPDLIHTGGNSGFQSINLAMIFLGFVGRVILIGFDMKGDSHFFGKHPFTLISKDASRFIPHFKRAAQIGYPGIEIINCTPGSALECFPTMRLEDALAPLPSLVD